MLWMAHEMLRLSKSLAKASVLLSCLLVASGAHAQNARQHGLSKIDPEPIYPEINGTPATTKAGGGRDRMVVCPVGFHTSEWAPPCLHPERHPETTTVQWRGTNMPEPNEPATTETSQQGNAGNAQRPAAQGPSAETVTPSQRPNYDNREEAISETRKPAGPPLREGAASPESLEEEEAGEEPVDPS
jgi:hypothetical protein